jgi:hypothetical protein
MGLRRRPIELALATLLAGLVAALAACSGALQPTASQPTSSQLAASQPAAVSPSTGQTAVPGLSRAGGNCSPAPPITPLPVWARAGFQPPGQPMPHVMGARGSIVAILWAAKDALRSPQLPDLSNKILWVSKLPVNPLSPLTIRATLAGTGQTVTRTVAGGPGPSGINLPAAGCWTLQLSWSGHTDQLRLRYVSAHAQ